MICPTCKKEFIADPKDKAYPFCKMDCKMIDLYGWLFEENIISTPINKDEEEEY